MYIYMYIYMFLYIYMYICIRRCTVDPRKLEHGFRRLCARIPNILYLKGMRILMFQLSGFYYRCRCIYEYEFDYVSIHMIMLIRIWVGLQGLDSKLRGRVLETALGRIALESTDHLHWNIEPLPSIYGDYRSFRIALCSTEPQTLDTFVTSRSQS